MSKKKLDLQSRKVSVVPSKATPTRSWETFAKDVAECWGAPRVGGFPPSATLRYMASVAYWQASNIEGFKGSKEKWYAAVRAALPQNCPHEVED